MGVKLMYKRKEVANIRLLLVTTKDMDWVYYVRHVQK